MVRVIEIRDLKKIDATAIQVLRCIDLHLGEREQGYVPYDQIATSLNIKRDAVAKAVNRMVANRILAKKNGLLSIPIAKLKNI